MTTRIKRTSVPPIARAVLSAVLAFHGLGCVGAQSNDARRFDSFPPETLSGESRYGISIAAYVQVQGAEAASSLRGGTTSNARNAYAYWLERTRRARVDEAGPYRAQILVEDRGSGSGAVFAGFVTVLSLYVIPSWASHDYRTTVRVLDEAGQVVGQTYFRHRLTVVQQLFMALAMPFTSIQSSYDKMWNAVMRDAAAWTVESLDASSPEASRDASPEAQHPEP